MIGIRNCLLALVPVLLAAGVSGQDEFPLVETSLGFIGGSYGADGFTEQFFGIQYANVPERFARSEVIDEPFEDDYYNASSFGPKCWQENADPTEDEYSEFDCLVLNIYRPTFPDGEEPLSTMVWIHGGSLISGAGEEDDGTYLSLLQNVIVITINYRLGVLGFIAQDEDGTGGLNGMDDQINALKWINQHIESFGGTNSSITIFGESSGGDSVTVLSVSPLASGLFQRAIVMSGPAGLGWRPFNPDKGWEVTESTLAHHGAASIEALKSVDDFPAQQIVTFSPEFEYLEAFPDFAQMIDSKYTIDGLVLSDRPHTLYTNPDNINPEAMMIGSNSYDGTLGLSDPSFMNGFVLDEAMRSVFGDDLGDAIFAAYNPNDPPYAGFANATYAATINIEGDYQVTCPTRELAAKAAASGYEGPVYLYNYQHFFPGDLNALFVGDDVDVNRDGWASHASETFVLFGTDIGEAFGFPFFDNATIAMSEELMARWATFAKTGDPNLPEYATWTSMSNTGISIPNDEGAAKNVPWLVFRDGTSTMMGDTEAKASQCDLFVESYMQNEGNVEEGGIPPPEESSPDVEDVIGMEEASPDEEASPEE